MISNSGAQVSSESLINLQGELNTLSGNLNELYELLGQDLSRLGEYWRDSKYDEFMQEFHSSREKINELSEKYHEWANSYLPPRIEIIQKAEKANMSVDSAPSGGGGDTSGSAEAVAGGGMGAPVSRNEKIEKFREAQRKVEEMARKQAEEKKVDPRIIKKIIDDKSEMGDQKRDIHADARAAAAAAEKAKKEKEQALQEFMRRMADNHR